MGKTRRLMCLGGEKQQASSEDDEVVNVAKRYAYGGILMRTRSRSASPQRSKKENLAPRASEMLESMPRPSHVARGLEAVRMRARARSSTPSSLVTNIVPLVNNGHHARDSEGTARKSSMLRQAVLHHREASRPRSWEISQNVSLSPLALDDKRMHNKLAQVLSLQRRNTNTSCTFEFQDDDAFHAKMHDRPTAARTLLVPVEPDLGHSSTENGEGSRGTGGFLPTFLCQSASESRESKPVSRKKGVQTPELRAILGDLGSGRKLHRSPTPCSGQGPRWSKELASTIRSTLILPVGNTGTVFGLQGMGVSLSERDIEEERRCRDEQIQDERKHEKRLRPLTASAKSRSPPGLTAPLQSGAQQRAQPNKREERKNCADILANLGLADAPTLSNAKEADLATESGVGIGERVEKRREDVGVGAVLCAADIRVEVKHVGDRERGEGGGEGGECFEGESQEGRSGRPRTVKYKRPTTTITKTRTSPCPRQHMRTAQQSASPPPNERRLTPANYHTPPSEGIPDFRSSEEHDAREVEDLMSPTQAVKCQVTAFWSSSGCACARTHTEGANVCRLG
eukprot:Tamp_04176.p1 GENE.Tamp_04176~~Tamp_04176.p1  ORF type:complete len:570 (-),score=40.44 Tamp_04176:986-2695(-)